MNFDHIQSFLRYQRVPQRLLKLLLGEIANRNVFFINLWKSLRKKVKTTMDFNRWDINSIQSQLTSVVEVTRAS